MFSFLKKVPLNESPYIMGQSRLNGLDLINVRRIVKTNTGRVLNEPSTKTRRLNSRLE